MPVSAQKTPQKNNSAQLAVVEIPNTVGWLPGKRLFIDCRRRFIAASLRRPDAERVLAHAVSWEEKIYRFFGVRKSVKQPVLIVIMENEREMKQFSKQKRFQGMSLSIPTATEDTRIIVLTNNKEGLRNILPHELAHLCVIDITRSLGRTKDHQHPAPLCINEGIAERFTSETEKQNIRRHLYRSVLRNKFLYLDTILYTTGYPDNMRDLALFYCQSYSLVDYILSLPGGKQKLIVYLQRFDHASENPYELFKEIFCGKVSSQTFQTAWMRYIYEQYRTPPQPPKKYQKRTKRKSGNLRKRTNGNMARAEISYR